MKQYKALFIDWDDTIGDFHGAADLALEEMFDKYQLARFFESSEEFVSLYKPHNIELWALYGEDKVTKEYLSLDRFLYPLMHGSKAGERLKAKGERQEVVALAEQMSEDFLALTTKHFSLLPGAEAFVRRLAEKYPLTILSNGFIEVQYEKIERSGLQDLFAHVVLSEEVGCQKPNPRIFEVALEKNGIAAEDALMIGDSWTSDIQGAQNAGIDQMWIVGEDTSVQDKTATYIVRSLSEALEIL